MGFLPDFMTHSMPLLSPIIWILVIPNTSSAICTRGKARSLIVESIATISASGVECETQVCLFDKYATGIFAPLLVRKTIDPVVDLCVCEQPAKSESEYTRNLNCPSEAA